MTGLTGHRLKEITSAYNFTPAQAAAIETGAKFGTLREPRIGKLSVHAAPGQKLLLYTGLHTSNARLLGSAICTASLDMHVDLRQPMLVTYPAIGVTFSGRMQLDTLAIRAGYRRWNDLWSFLSDTLKGDVGNLVHILWRDFTPTA